MPNVCGTCTQESDSAFCLDAGISCGSAQGLDNCHVARSAQCGSCATGLCLNGSCQLACAGGLGFPSPPVSTLAINRILGVAIADFNRDGRADVAVGDENHGVSVSYGTDSGQLVGTVTIPSSGWIGLAVADFNHDGWPDILSAGAGFGSGEVVLNLNEKDGGFFVEPLFPCTNDCYAVGAADFNRDGIVDLVIGSDSNFTVYFGLGNGTFQTAGTYSNGSEPQQFVVADFNNDGWPDLFVPSGGGPVIFINQQDGSFDAGAGTNGLAPWPGAVADVDGDGLLDLIAPSYFGVQWFRNVDGTHFVSQGMLLGDATAQEPVVGSVGGSGVAQVALVSIPGTNPLSSSYLVMPLRPDGGAAVRSFIGPQAGIFVESGDFNGDGWADLLMIGGTEGSLLEGTATDVSAPTVATLAGSPASQLGTANVSAPASRDLLLLQPADNVLSRVSLLADGGLLREVFAAGRGPSSWTAADFSGDGQVDVAVASQTDNAIALLINGGGGVFPTCMCPGSGTDAGFCVVDGGNPDAGPCTAYVLTLPSQPVALTSGDVNGDGSPDLLVATADQQMRVFLNHAGSFSPGQVFDAGGTVWAAALLSLTDAGLRDLVVTDSPSNGQYQGSSTINSFVNDGGGGFTLTHIIPGVAGGAGPIAIGDLDGDGVEDVVVSYRGIPQGPPGGSTVSVFLNRLNGQLSNEVDYNFNEAYGQFSALAVSDVNGDGHADVVVLDMGFRHLLLLVNKGDGTLAAPSYYSIPPNTQSMLVRDFNGDLRPDVLVLSTDLNTLNWMWGTCH
jgi:hypothetical protein